MRIVVEGNFSPASSYGIVNFELAQQMFWRGHHVAVVSLDLSNEEMTRQFEHLQGARICVGEPEGCVEVRLRQMWPPVWGRRGGEKLVIIQPWEFGSIPLSWLAGIREADAIWVPSVYCKRGYVQSGVDSHKVWVVPNGVHLDEVENIREAARNNRDGGALTRILFLGGTIQRKGIDVLVAALDQLDDETLAQVYVTVKDVGTQSFYRNQSLLSQSLDAHPRVSHRVAVRDHHLPRAELLALIASSDVLVHPYRSEGFAMGVLEAMAVGTPVIHTRGGATNEFCAPSESLLIPSTFQVAQVARVGTEILADRSYWFEPSIEGLRDILLRVHRGEVDLEQLSKRGHEHATEWTWERAGDVALESLESVLEGRGVGDEFTLLEHDLKESLAQSGQNAAGLLSRLVAMGDVHSAANFAREVELRLYVHERGSISSVRESLDNMASSTPDVWSGAGYRSLIHGAQHRRTGHFAYAHDFEGGDHATYQIAQRLSEYLGACDSILDIACGQGSMLRVCRSRGQRVQGIEADPELVRQLRADGLSIFEGFVPRDLASIHPEPFDGVFVGHLVEHLTPPECQELLEWIFEHIADRGTIVLQTPDFSTSSVGLENFWLDSTHVRPYPVRLLKAMLSKTGFVALEGACGPVRDVAPLDVIAVGRRVARVASSRENPSIRTAADSRVGHFGLFSGLSGFAHATRTLFDGETLAAHGVDVVKVDVAGERDAMTPSDVVAVRALDGVECDVAILDVPLGWTAQVSTLVRSKYRVARTTFEATPVPSGLRNTLRSFDEVWCFSRYDAQIFVDSGVSREKVHVVSPRTAPVDVREVSRARADIARERFRFLSVFSFEPRKNPEALLRAFASVAAVEPECDLVLKVRGVTPAQMEAWLMRTLDSRQAQCVRGRVQVITPDISSGALSGLYLGCDAFVLPSRGEGFGLPFLEALSHGLATICPDVGGHRDFCTEENSLLVATSSVSANVHAPSELFLGSSWREVDSQELCHAMLRAVRERAFMARLGERGLNDAADFSRRNAATSSEQRIIDILQSRLQEAAAQ